MKDTKLEFYKNGELIDFMYCSDFIPYKDDYITINNETYTVIGRQFNYDDNVIEIYIR